jgi:hypothetical protein
VRHISLKDLGPLQALIKNPELLKASMELMKEDGRTMQDKMMEIMTKNPELAKAIQDPTIMSAMTKVMEDETVKQGIEPLVSKYMEQLKEKKK